MVVLSSASRRDAFAHIKSYVQSSFVYDWNLKVQSETLDIVETE